MDWESRRTHFRKQTWAQSFPPGRARGFRFDPPARGPLQTVCERPARMLVAEASEQKLDGQVFWLTAPGGSRTPSRLAAVAWLSGDLADYSGGPATDLHRLPYYPPPVLDGESTCRVV